MAMCGKMRFIFSLFISFFIMSLCGCFPSQSDIEKSQEELKKAEKELNIDTSIEVLSLSSSDSLSFEDSLKAQNK